MRLVIRKVQYAPEKPGPQPMVETTRSFLMSDRSLHLEASLDKEVRAHTPHVPVWCVCVVTQAISPWNTDN